MTDVSTHVYLGSSHTIMSSAHFEDNEYTLPQESLQEESDVPSLLDGGYQPDVFLSEHVIMRDVISRDSRYFRMDELLLLCVDIVIGNFPSKVEVSDTSL